MFSQRAGELADRPGASLHSPANRGAFGALVVVLVVLCSWHVAYLVLSRMLPSWDEAHYLGGALQVARGFRRGGLEGAWHAYLAELVFKPPLITLPAAALNLLLGEGVLPAMLSLVLIFIGVGLAGWSLFRNILPPVHAAGAAALLCTAPMITGLTHRFYVESLLLLLSVLYLDVLVRHSWSSTKWAVLAGLLLGLGVLTKLTFPPLLFIPSLYLLFHAVRGLPRAEFSQSLVILSGRVGLMLITAFAIAWPWYARNWRPVFQHSRTFFWAEVCAYPNLASFFSNISSGPYFFVFCLAVAGLVPLLRALSSRTLAVHSHQAWTALLLLGLVTFLITTISINKATRFSVTWLPTIAALASYAFFAYLRSSRRRLTAVATASALSMILTFQNSFGVLPLPALRLGDLRIVDSRYPLNIPDWFDDNHPVDRKDYRQREAEDLIAADAASHLPARRTPTIRVTVDSILLSADLMGFLSTLRGRGADYRSWPGTSLTAENGPDYVLHAKNLSRPYPGRQSIEYYARFDTDVSLGKLPFEEIAHLAGPGGVEILIFRKKNI